MSVFVEEDSVGHVISGLPSARWDRSVFKSLDVSNCGSRDLLRVTPGSKPCGVYRKYRHASQSQFPRTHFCTKYVIDYQASRCLLQLQDLKLIWLVAKSSYFVMFANDRSASWIPEICDSLFGTSVQHAWSCYAKFLVASSPGIFPNHNFLPPKFTFPSILTLFFVQLL